MAARTSTRDEAAAVHRKWMAERMFLLVPSQAVVGQWLQSFKEFPIWQKRASFNLEEVIQQLPPT